MTNYRKDNHGHTAHPAADQEYEFMHPTRIRSGKLQSEADKEAKTMASIPGQEEFLAIIGKGQEAVIAVVRILARTVRSASPKLPSVSVPFADKLPGPEGAVASTYDFAEHLLASQRKFTEDLLKAAAPLITGNGASATETYKPGQVVPSDGTVQCALHPDVQNHVKTGTRFAPCSHHHEHSQGCSWQYV